MKSPSPLIGASLCAAAILCVGIAGFVTVWTWGDKHPVNPAPIQTICANGCDCVDSVDNADTVQKVREAMRDSFARGQKAGQTITLNRFLEMSTGEVTGELRFKNPGQRVNHLFGLCGLPPFDGEDAP